MSSRPWYRWYPGDYLQDTLHLTLAQDALYRRLLDALWIYGPLPDEPKYLARICRVDVRQVRASRDAILRMMCVTDGIIDHPKIREQREQLAEISEKRAESGRKGGQAIAKQVLNPSRAGADPEPDLEPEDQNQDLKPPLPEGFPAKQSKPKANGSDFAPPDWIPPESWAGFEGMRKAGKHPLTDHARGLAVKTLERLFRDGHQPGDVLDQSTLHGWRGLHPTKEDRGNGRQHRDGPETLADRILRKNPG